jgi:hypothetical protein
MEADTHRLCPDHTLRWFELAQLQINMQSEFIKDYRNYH